VSVLGAWNFSPGTGTTTPDLSGNGRTMTVHGWGEPHNTGFSAKGDGSTYACGLSGDLGLNAPSALGIMMWANLSTPSGNPDIITLKESDESSYVGIYWGDSGHLRLYLQDSAGYQESALVPVPVGTWVHYAIALSATSVVLYMNAQVAATLTRSAGSTMGNLTSFSLGGSIGSSGGSPGLYFDAQLLNTTPSQSDVKTAMHTPLGHTATVTEPTWAIEWAADEGTGTTVADSSGNGHTGTAASDGWVTGLAPHSKAAAGNSTNPAVKLEGTTVISGSQTLTMMANVNAVTYTGSGDLLEVKSDHSSTTYATIYRPSVASLQLEIKDTGGTTTDTIEYPKATTGVWTHIGAVIDTSSISLYVDGELVVKKTRTGSTNLGAVQLFYAGGTDTKNNQAAVNDVRWSSGVADNDTMRYLAQTPVAGSKTYSPAPSDAVGITDALTTSVSASRTISDPVGITDALSSAVTQPRSVADPVGITDNFSSSTSLQRSFSDAIGITDDLDLQVSSVGTVSSEDEIGITDDVGFVQVADRTLSDDIDIADILLVDAQMPRSLDDDIGISDEVGFTTTMPRSISDAVSITDSLSVHVINAGLHTYVWDGTNEIEGQLSYWDGVQELPVTIEIQG